MALGPGRRLQPPVSPREPGGDGEQLALQGGAGVKPGLPRLGPLTWPPVSELRL